MSRPFPLPTIGVLAIVLSAGAQAQQPPSAEELPRLAAPVGKHLGSLSCASTSCHGRQEEQPGSSSVSRREFALWLAHDPHARAGRTLESREFDRILRRTSSGRDDGPADAAVRERCLACHAPRGDALEAASTAAFSCETCHGPAGDWIAVHYERGVSREQLISLGMRDTKDLAVRARLCAGCHVGDGERDMNHDMLAAGHPPPRFELSAYHDLIGHKHWPAAERVRTPQFKARLWAEGQAATMELTLELVHGRAARAASGERLTPWPELAEYDCFACHQRLRPVDRVAGVSLTGDRPGMPGWQPWNLALAGQLVSEDHAASALADLRREMNGSLVTDADRVRDLAASARRSLEVRRPLSAAQIVALVGPAIERDAWWAARSQQLLALRAADLAIRDERLRLQPPPGYVSVTSGREERRQGAVDERDRQWRSIAAALQFPSSQFDWPALDWEGLGPPPPGAATVATNERLAAELQALLEELRRGANEVEPP